MNSLSHFFSRAVRACKPGKGKAGSSLALVMMIGAALVIWVMCIMPLMTTTGTAAIQTQQSYDDYLDSRSSIEFCKGELEHIVTEEMPYSFAVIRKDDDTYEAIRREDAGSHAVSLQYKGYVQDDPTDVTKDVPKSDDEGNKVAAICSVVLNAENSGQYDITIGTFHNGDKGHSYSLTFTASGSLLIFPESYRQNQALPLSDFAVVDGKLGGNEIWKSTIDMSKAIIYSGDVPTGTGDFTETLLPYKLLGFDGVDPGVPADYADAGEYPAAFKKVAQAPTGTASIGVALTDGEFTGESWTVPEAVASDAANKQPGNIWYEFNKNEDKIQIFLYQDKDNTKVDITNSCAVYLNGSNHKEQGVTEPVALPDKEGRYCVTVDYPGTGAYSADSLSNILPGTGLRMPDPLNWLDSYQQDAPGAHSLSVKRVAGGVQTADTYTVTLTPEEDGILYSCCASDEIPANGKCQVTWSESNEFTGLSVDKTYYFYACRPAAIKDGKYYRDSEIKYLGAICPVEYATELEAGQSYAVVGESGGKSYAMNSDLSAMEFTVCDGCLIVGANDSINLPTWTASGSVDQWSLKTVVDGAERFLAMTVTYTYDRWTWEGVWTFYLGRNSDSSNGIFTVAFQGTDGTDATVSRECPANDWRGRPTTKTASLAFSNNQFTAIEGTNSTVKFLKVPSVDPPVVTSPSSYTLYDKTMTDGIVLPYETKSLDYIKDHIIYAGDTENSLSKQVRTVYANGEEFTTLNAGVYNLVAEIEVGTTIDKTTQKATTVYRYAALGDITILKDTRPEKLLNPDIKFTDNQEGELTVTVGTGASNKLDNSSGVLYFGYKKVPTETDDTSNMTTGTQVGTIDPDFHWFPAEAANGQSFTFRLQRGSYYFAVCKFGTSKNESITTIAKHDVKYKDINLVDNDGAYFVYTVEPEPDDNGKYAVKWYRLPQDILPGRVTLVSSEDGTTWTDQYSKSPAFYGVRIVDSAYEESVFPLGHGPIRVTNEKGHTTAMMRGSSLYFMGREVSINTYGNSVYLNADLLVLNEDILLDDQGRGQVIVMPYSKGDGKPGDTLFFNSGKTDFVHSGVTYKSKTFYRVQSGTDLCNPESGQIEELGGVEEKKVRDLFRLEIYPEINLDIAYADDAQLACVISSETIQWTNKGVLHNNGDTSTNPMYVVCAYVSDISGGVSYKANRVLIAAKNHKLDVSANLTFTTRYLSIDADLVQGSSGAEFWVKNLGQDKDFFQSASDYLGLTTYRSKSLQVDFERNTIIKANGNESSVERQIYRYDNDANLFGGATPQTLMATYTTGEISDFFSDSNSYSSTVKTVDRYVAITGSNSTSRSLTVTKPYNAVYDIYANYILFDEDVDSIQLSLNGWPQIAQVRADVTINSQESGYTTNEYLGLFKGRTAESYTGTLVYVKKDLPISCRVQTGSSWGFPVYGTVSGTIKSGFYYVYASDNGTSITDLLPQNLFQGDDPSQNTAEKPYMINPSLLSQYSVYIKSDGSISNAYVDTGIFDNTNTGRGGFSGGNVG